MLYATTATQKNNLRNVANSVLDDGGLLHQPIPAWIEQKETVEIDGDNETPDKNSNETDTHIKQETDLISPQITATTNGAMIESNTISSQTETKEERRAAKKAKQEAKEARRRERAEKREAKQSRKEVKEEEKKLKKEAKEAKKKLKKEAKKRKREEQRE